jgi:HD-GYP domain-containing protein (c-di-GMP phosphodiesterase class II)
MLRDNPRVQDLVLVVARWAVLGGLVLVNTETPEPLIPLPILVGLGMYALFITIAFIGAWAGSRLFAYVQSVGDLAVVAAALILASNILGRAYIALLVVAALIGLRRFPWRTTVGFAVLAAIVGVLAEYGGLDVLPTGAEAGLAAGVVLLARLLAGDPLPADYLERRPPVRADQAQGLLALGKKLDAPSETKDILADAHRAITTHTGAARAAVVLLDDAPGTGHAYIVTKDGTQAKPFTCEPDSDAPDQRVLRGGALRLVRQRDPLPVVEVLGERGATSFLGVPLRTGGMTVGALLAYDKEGARGFAEQDEAFLDLVATPMAAALLSTRAASAAAVGADLFTQGLLAMLTLRRPEAEAHAEQVARFAEAIGQEMGLSAAEMADLHQAALLHDVGEIGVAGDPFNRTQTLSSDEYERIKEHPWIGARLLAGLDQPSDMLDMVHQHHERWDGTGYPQKLERADVLLGARILAVADALDAMTADRPYRAARPVREALQELIGGSGSQFDPAVVQALVSVVSAQGEGWVAAPPRRAKSTVEPWRRRIRR